MIDLAVACYLGATGGFLFGYTAANCRRPTSRELLSARQRLFSGALSPPSQSADWRRSFNHENMNPPKGMPPLKLQRSMHKLSPAAQVVLDSYWNTLAKTPQQSIAAALRAAANEILPTDSDWHEAFVRLATELEN